MRILIAGGGTGGHLMPALAIADALRDTRPDVEVVLVGAQRGIEAALLQQRSYRFHLLPAEPLYRGRWWRNARWPLAAWRLLRGCRRVLGAERPAVVVGTGGYAAAPMMLTAVLAGVPLVLQEQNAFPGLTTRGFARWAKLIHLGFPEAEQRLRVRAGTRVFAYGNPITPPGSGADRSEARATLGIASQARVVFAFGGSQGARPINRVLGQLLDDGALDAVTVCWGTGSGEWEEYRRFDAPPRRIVRPFWDPIAQAYAAADVAVARAGAMTTAELCGHGVPAVLIPLATAAADHQTYNARALVAAGAALHLPEGQLTPESLLRQVESVLNDPERARQMRLAALARAHPNAARQIAETIVAMVS